MLRKSGITLHTNYQCEIVRDIKEKITQCRLENAYEKLQDDEEMNCEQYKMPDGTILQIGNARYRSSELLFGPHLMGLQCKGIQHEILDCINDCDLANRKDLMSHITLIGGTSLLKGFGRRLVNELVSTDYNRISYDHIAKTSTNSKDRGAGNAYSKVQTTSNESMLASTKPQKVNKKTGIRIYAPVNRQYSAWTGGSVLCAMDSFEEMWIDKKQYEEFGKNILFRQ